MSILSTLKKVFVMGALLSLVGQGCTNAPTAEETNARRRIELSVWGVIDDIDAYDPVFQAYRRSHPNVSFYFRRLRLEEYEAALLDAMAEDRGPDIFLIHNTWVTKYQSKIAPMPATAKVGYAVTTGGGVKSETTWTVRDEANITLRQFKDQYADVVLKDVLRTINVGTADKVNYQERVMAMPVGIDTLAVYYNKDLLNAGGVPNPPDNWVQFQEQVGKLTKLDDDRTTILQSAAGMGTANNVGRASDLLSVLMMQSGARMTDQNGVPSFQQIPPNLDGQIDEPPAYRALEFYTSFADPNKETFTWDDKQPNSLDAFIQGKSAFFFGYSYHFAQIKARAPRLNLGISKLPQIENNPVKNFANYWVWTVSKKSKNAPTAWNFLNFMQQPDNVKGVVDRLARPAARKSLLPVQLENERVGIFAAQVLTADSWYRGRDPQAMEAAMLEMITQVNTAQADIPRAIRFAVDKIAQTVY